MTITVAKRLIKSGFTNFFRNIWLSLGATLIMGITLLTISTIFLLYTATQLSLGQIQDKVGVSIYFKDEVSLKEIQNIKAELELMPEIKAVEFIPKDVAVDKFREAHQDEPLLLETLDEFKDSENPLPNSFAVKAYDLKDYDKISEVLSSDRYAPYFERIRDDKTVIDRLLKIFQIITRLGLVLIIVFSAVTVMVMFNTIRLTIYNRREEVEIMRLVGATNWYIRAPFIVEGIMYALIATIIISLMILSVIPLLTRNIAHLLKLPYNLGSAYVQALFWKIVITNLLFSLTMGVVASSIAMRKYLRI